MQDIKIIFLKFAYFTTVRCLYICVSYIPLFWNSPVKNLCPGRHFMEFYGNIRYLRLYYSKCFTNTISRNTSADRKKSSAEVIHFFAFCHLSPLSYTTRLIVTICRYVAVVSLIPVAGVDAWHIVPFPT